MPPVPVNVCEYAVPTTPLVSGEVVVIAGVPDAIAARPKFAAPVVDEVPAEKLPTTTCAPAASALVPVVRSVRSTVVTPGGSCAGKLQRAPGVSGVLSGFVAVLVFSQ